MSDRIHVATRKGLFSVRRGASGWRIERASMPGVHFTVVLPDGRGSLYAAAHHEHFGDKIHKSTDGGATWTEVGVPVYPEPPEGHVETDAFGRELKWKLKLIWALETSGRGDDGLWCGTIPGGLFRSDDGGATWELNRGLWDHEGRKSWFGGGADLPGIHSICVDPRDPSVVRVGVSCGGVWQTDDDGATWECRADGMRCEYMPPEQANDPGIQDAHHIEQSPSHPDVLWCQHHNGIFKSIDGSASWTEVEAEAPSRFGFACAVHPTNPEVAWFVPAVKDEVRIPVDGKLVVTRTSDGGETFEVLSNGLPQEHAYDLVFRHGLDVDESGERLVFGSTTGGLFVSEDGGEGWACVSAHLPPVYAVRFE
ncbi:MAG: WD40/YVTN/BNR-like repeat-containing protein [Planctomycetota bacterium JB042]